MKNFTHDWSGERHDLNMNHYRFARRIDNYHPESRNRDHIVGRWSLGIIVFLLALYAIGVNV
jgi:hypothetical protein